MRKFSDPQPDSVVVVVDGGLAVWSVTVLLVTCHAIGDVLAGLSLVRMAKTLIMTIFRPPAVAAHLLFAWLAPRAQMPLRHDRLLALLAATASAMREETLTVEREACTPYSADMCPAAAAKYSEVSHQLSYIGLFASPAGQWACEKNDYCGYNYWSRNGDCGRMDCARRMRDDPDFCSKRMTGCSKSCGCDLGGTADKVALMVPDGLRDLSAPGAAPARPDELSPLIIWLHGYTGQGDWVKKMWKLDSGSKKGTHYVDEKRVLIASPNGALDDLGFPYWNSGSAYHGRFVDRRMDSQQAFSTKFASKVGYHADNLYNHTAENRDEQYLLRLLERLKTKYPVDPARVYLAGSANGGLMAYAMACKHASLFAGVVVHGAGQDQSDLDHCRPSHPLHILHVQGTKDFFDIDDAFSMLGYWADLNGCDSTKLEGPVGSPGEVWAGDEHKSETFASTAGCRRGGSVTLWRLQGAPHFPFWSDRFPGLVMDFIANAPLRTATAPPGGGGSGAPGGVAGGGGGGGGGAAAGAATAAAAAAAAAATLGTHAVHGGAHARLSALSSGGASVDALQPEGVAAAVALHAHAAPAADEGPLRLTRPHKPLPPHSVVPF